MYEKFTDKARKVMQLANQEAQRFNHEYIGTEHILLGLIEIGEGFSVAILARLEVNLHKLKLEIEKLVTSGPDMITMGRLPQTPRAKKVIELAMESARAAGRNYVTTGDLLLGLLNVEDAIVLPLLISFKVSPREVGERLAELTATSANAANEDSDVVPVPEPDISAKEQELTDRYTQALKIARDLLGQAQLSGGVTDVGLVLLANKIAEDLKEK
jgi:ATP-dependent Clp protease ATP-binding subunit ClpA